MTIVRVVQIATIAAADVVRLYVHDGSTAFLFAELLFAANTPSDVNAVSINDWTPPGTDGLFLPAGYSLRASTDNGDDYNAFAFGGDF